MGVSNNTKSAYFHCIFRYPLLYWYICWSLQKYPLCIPISITVFIYMLTTVEISIIYSGIHHCIDIYADHCRNIHYIFRYPRQLIYMLTTVELSIIYFGIHHCIDIYADHSRFIHCIFLVEGPGSLVVNISSILGSIAENTKQVHFYHFILIWISTVENFNSIFNPLSLDITLPTTCNKDTSNYKYRYDALTIGLIIRLN